MPKTGPTARPRVLFFDIESAGVQGLRADRGFVVCFGYKWLGEKTTNVLTIKDYAAFRRDPHDDSALLKDVLKIMEEADLVVAHYGAKFDLPFLRSRIAKAGLKPLPQTRNTDTCLIARSYFKLSSNRLDNLAEFLDCSERKMEKGHGWPDWWMGVLKGDKASIDKMAVYCAQDVRTLEAVYMKMRNIIPQRYLVHHGIGLDHYVCAACGGAVQMRGTYYSEKKIWRRFQCKECGKWGREDKAIARPYSGHQPGRSNALPRSP